MIKTIDKKALHLAIEAKFSELLAVAIHAAQQAHESATHEENKAENKYDTLGLEAAYLAEGQSRRVDELSQTLAAFKKLPIKVFNEEDEISLGALIAVTKEEANNLTNQPNYLFYTRLGGGVEIQFNELSIMVITDVSPLGKALKSAYVEDEVIVRQGDRKISYKVLGLW